MKYRYQMNECFQVASEFLLENVIVPLIMLFIKRTLLDINITYHVHQKNVCVLQNTFISDLKEYKQLSYAFINTNKNLRNISPYRDLFRFLPNTTPKNRFIFKRYIDRALNSGDVSDALKFVEKLEIVIKSLYFSCFVLHSSIQFISVIERSPRHF